MQILFKCIYVLFIYDARVTEAYLCCIDSALYWEGGREKNKSSFAFKDTHKNSVFLFTPKLKTIQHGLVMNSDVY